MNRQEQPQEEQHLIIFERLPIRNNELVINFSVIHPPWFLYATWF